jgi:hypothetical protein
MNIRTIISITFTFSIFSLALANEKIKNMKGIFEHLPSVKGEFIETVHDFRKDYKSEGGELVYGADGSRTRVVAYLGRGSARVAYFLVDTAGKALPPSESFWKDGKSMRIEENGHSGHIGGKPSGFINPLTLGFFVEGSPVWELGKTYKVIDAQGGFTLVDKDWRINATLQESGPTRMMKQVSPDKNQDMSNRTEYVIEEEELFDGSYFPKLVGVRIFLNNQISFEKTYTLIKLETAKESDLTPVYAEKGLVKDQDTGIVYEVRNGKLVRDEAFSNEVAQGISSRRFLFFGALGVLGLAIAFVLIQVRRRSVVTTPDQV